jgi:acyl dehydratase
MNDPLKESRASLEGKQVNFQWPISQCAIDQFGSAIGEEHPIHSDEAAARAAGFSGTIVPGTFLVALTGNAAARLFKAIGQSGLAYGYDRIRFLRPVSTTETLTVNYTIVSHDLGSGMLRASVEIKDRHDSLVFVGIHLSKIF